MLKLLGAVLVWGGCGIMGACSAGQMRRRVRFLEEMGRALELMEREILLKHTALPELLDMLCSACRGQTQELFLACREEIAKGDSFTYSWMCALERIELPQEDREVLGSLVRILGQYDAGEQGRGLSSLREELACRAARNREEARSMGRVYCVLGLTVGGFLSLSLL